MRKKGLRKIRTAINLGRILVAVLGLLSLCGPVDSIRASGPAQHPSQDSPALPERERLLYQAGQLQTSPGREGTGTITWKTPDEWLRLRFRLLARDPEALRLELFDPFGRPAAYFFSYQGRFFLVSNEKKQEIFPQAVREGPLAIFSGTPARDFLKILWGRIPIIPHERMASEAIVENNLSLVKLSLEGLQKQWIWLSPDPFSVRRTRIQDKPGGGDWQASFSDFIPGPGGRFPRQIEIQEESGGKELTLRFETLIPRPDIPETAFTD